MLDLKGKQDAIDYFLQLAGFNVTTADIKGPFWFMFDKELDENWRILYQALALCVVLLQVILLDKHGAFVHLRSRRLNNTPDLIVAVGDVGDADYLCALAHKRGLVTPQGDDDDNKKDEKEIDPNVPAVGEKVLLTTPSGTYGGVILQNRKCTEKAKREWLSKWAKKPCRILHLKLGGDTVAITVSDRVSIYGRVLSFRFPRFLRKAYKRRTKATKDTAISSYISVSSHARNRVLAILPVALQAFEKDVSRFLPKAAQEREEKKSA